MSIAPSDEKGHKVLARAFSDADLKLVSDGVVAACDELDGVKDGLINDYPACRFDPAVLQCKTGKQTDCLSHEQVRTPHGRRIFAGPTNRHGEALYSSWPYDAGIASPGWRIWKLGFSQDAEKPDALNATLGGGVDDGLLHDAARAWVQHAGLRF